MTTPAQTSERADLLEALTKHRTLFRFTAQGLTDEQAATRTTASELTVAGLIKHVCRMEKEWATFITEGPAETPDVDWQDIDWSNPPAEVLDYQNGFRMVEGETLAGLLEEYAAVAATTDALLETLPSLDVSHPLPEAPWFEAGARWTARRVFVHLVAETAQHAGHADIIRESLDGQRSMG